MFRGDFVTSCVPSTPTLMMPTCIYITLLANPTPLGSAGSQGPKPAVYTLHTLHKGWKNDLENAFECRFQGCLLALAVLPRNLFGQVPGTSPGASWPLDMVTNHCNRNRPKCGGGEGRRDVECAVTDTNGESGLLRPHGGWGTFLHIFVSPAPCPPVKNTANDHTPASLKEEKRINSRRRRTESQLCPPGCGCSLA